jgi:hypothetical protein
MPIDSHLPQADPFSLVPTFKGSLTRNFRLKVFFRNQPPKPQGIPLGPFQIFRKFAEICTAQGVPQVSLSPVANGKNLQ